MLQPVGLTAPYCLTLLSQATVWGHEWPQWAPTNEVWESRWASPQKEVEPGWVAEIWEELLHRTPWGPTHDSGHFLHFSPSHHAHTQQVNHKTYMKLTDGGLHHFCCCRQYWYTNQQMSGRHKSSNHISKQRQQRVFSNICVFCFPPSLAGMSSLRWKNSAGRRRSLWEALATPRQLPLFTRRSFLVSKPYIT